MKSRKLKFLRGKTMAQTADRRGRIRLGMRHERWKSGAVRSGGADETSGVRIPFDAPLHPVAFRARFAKVTMIGFIIKKIIGSKNDREVKRLRPMIAKINEFEVALQSQPEDVLRQKTAEWKARCAAITDHDELKRTIEEILPEAFAVVKNACRRLCART